MPDNSDCRWDFSEGINKEDEEKCKNEEKELPCRWKHIIAKLECINNNRVSLLIFANIFGKKNS